MSRKSRLQQRLGPSLTIYEVGTLYPQWQSWLDSASTLILDLSAVESIDAAGAQLLVLLKRECQQRQLSLQLTQHSSAVLQVFEQLQLGPLFGDPVVLTAKPSA